MMYPKTTDFRLMHPECIELTDDDFTQASQLASLSATSNSWQAYLQHLALMGVERWVQQQPFDCELETQDCSLNQLQPPMEQEAICNLKLGVFKLCLLVTENIVSEVISVPQSILNEPELAAHLYGLVEIEEEAGLLLIRGILRRDTWANQPDKSQWLVNDTYDIPLSQFELEPHRLSLYIRYLDPETIPLPIAPPVTIPPLVAASTETILNIARWVLQGLDELSQQLGFWQMDNLPPSLAMRGPLSQAFVQMIAFLQTEGLPIPASATPVYYSIELAAASYCLCLMPFPQAISPERASTQLDRWSLLAILGADGSPSLPNGISLEVRNEAGLLEVCELEEESAFLYVLVDAAPRDILTVTAISTRGETYRLPPLTFSPES